MAQATQSLVDALLQTADRLASGGGAYMWGHMGACNCGHLAQTMTQLSRAEIHQFALERYGDWATQVAHHCPASGYPFDAVIDLMLDAGLTHDDLTHLENLDASAVLAQIPTERRPLRRNRREDVVTYLRAWAELLTTQLPLNAEESLAAAHSQAVS